MKKLIKEICWYNCLYLRYLCFLRIVVYNTYCVMFLLLFFCFVLCTLCWQFLWIVNFDSPFGIL